MAEVFKKSGVPEFQPLKQEEIRKDFVSPDIGEEGEGATGISRAQALVDDYGKTIEFIKWVEGLLDDKMQDVSVTIDPNEEPETWMSMQRIFANPNPKISYKTYTQVLSALEEIEKVEAAANNPFAIQDEFISQLTNLGNEETASEAPEMDITTEDQDALDKATTIRTFGGPSDPILDAAIEKARIELDSLKQRLKWWSRWEWVVLNGARVNDATSNALALEALKQRILTLESAIAQAQETGDIKVLNG